MIKSFSSNTINCLKYYVYVYSDPDTKEPFYVGKGTRNRVFDHLDELSETDKAQKIKEIRERGKEPIIEILAHGLDNETALKVEAAAIDLIGIKNLTNLQRGHGSSRYGKIEVSKLEARYSADEVNKNDITDNMMLIRINARYRNDMTPFELYEATRGYWLVNFERVKGIKYILSVYDGMVLEVYEVAEWMPALSTFMDRTGRDNPENVEKRYEFVGRIADDDVRKRFLDKSVRGCFSKGERNPFKYGKSINKD